MRCDHITFDVNWIGLFHSSFNFVEISNLNMQGLTVYLEQKMKLASKKQSNGNAIMAHIGDVLAHMGNGTGNGFESMIMDAKRKYMVKTMHVKDMRVEIYMNALPVRTITV